MITCFSEPNNPRFELDCRAQQFVLIPGVVKDEVPMPNNHKMENNFELRIVYVVSVQTLAKCCIDH